MAIAARITAVTVIHSGHCDLCNDTGKDPETNWDDCPRCHGTSVGKRAVRLHLEPIRKGEVAGQNVLTVVDAPDVDLSGLVGTEIWGDSSQIMIGETKWADRVGYTRIRTKVEWQWETTNAK